MGMFGDDTDDAATRGLVYAQPYPPIVMASLAGSPWGALAPRSDILQDVDNLPTVGPASGVTASVLPNLEQAMQFVRTGQPWPGMALDSTGLGGDLSKAGSDPVPVQLAALGDQPPWPPGYDPSTWQLKKWDDGRWELTDPERQKYLPHREDKRHWRHWDIFGPGGDKRGSWPPNRIKPWPTQKVPPYNDQSATDPNGDALPWQPPTNPFAPLPEWMPEAPGARVPAVRIPGFGIP
jgi:hypothetical protein